MWLILADIEKLSTEKPDICYEYIMMAKKGLCKGGREKRLLAQPFWAWFSGRVTMWRSSSVGNALRGNPPDGRTNGIWSKSFFGSFFCKKRTSCLL